MAERRRSAAYRIAFASSAAFALAVAVLGVLVYYAADAAFRSQQDAALAEASAELVRDYRSEGYAELAETLRRRGGDTGVVTFGYALFDGDRRIAGDFQVALPRPGFSDVVFTDPVEGLDTARALATRLDVRHVLVVGVDSQALERIDGVILWLFVGAFVLVVLIGVAGALALGGYLRRRLDRISGTASAIMAGDLRRRVPVSRRGDEFDELGRVLNAMLDRIGRLLENLRQVSADVAHDLRTPLATLRGGLERAAGQSEAAKAAAIERAIQQSDALLALFAGILRIVEVDAGDVRGGFVRLDITALVADLCDSCSPALADGGRALSSSQAPDLAIEGDRELIAQALVNLVDNAQAHTPPGTTVLIEATGSCDTVRLTVADDGPGVPADALPRLTERFFRADRSRTAKGHGLGLNLVEAIARAHGGTLDVADNHPGLRVTLCLPRSPATL